MGGRGAGAAGIGTGRGRGNRGLALAIARRGGVSRADYLRGGMRPMGLLRGAFKGATAAQAEAIATGRRMVQNKRQMPSSPYLPPIKVTISARGKVHLTDGRHRMAAARDAGATRIRAEVRQLGKGGEVASTYVGPVKI